MAALHGGDIYRSSLINRDILDFSININPLGLPESVKKAAAAGIAESCRYPDVECRALRSALSHYEKVPEHSILFGNGAAELIYAFSLALRPRSVLLPAPTFSEYEESLSTIDCSIRYLMLDKNDGFTIHSGDLTAALTDSTDLLFLCNPNNPTGTLMSRDEIERVLTVCRDRHIRVLLDECFLDFTDDPKSCSATSLIKEYPNLFLLKAFTKKYAMAGFRLGYGLTSDQNLLQAMRQFIQPWNISVIAQKAGLAALSEEIYVSRARDIIHTERPRMTEALKELGYTVYESHANYILFEGPPELGEKALERGMMLRDCSNYTGLYKGCYRTAVKLPYENERLIKWLGQL